MRIQWRAIEAFIKNCLIYLKDDYDVIYVPFIGPDKRYPIDNHWHSLTQQVIDSIVRQAQGRKVIALGHSLGAVLSFPGLVTTP